MPELADVLHGARVAPAVFALRPDYRALLLVVDGLEPGPSDQTSEALLRAAESAAAEARRDRPVDQLPHVQAWRGGYPGFGAKPQRTPHNPGGPLRRAPAGPPPGDRRPGPS